MIRDQMKYLFPLLLVCALVAAPNVGGAQTNIVDMGCSPTVANPCTGSTGSNSPPALSPEMQQAAQAIGAALGDALHNALFGNPAEDARRAALLRQQRAVEAEAARLRAIEDAKLHTTLA